MPLSDSGSSQAQCLMLAGEVPPLRFYQLMGLAPAHPVELADSSMEPAACTVRAKPGRSRAIGYWCIEAHRQAAEPFLGVQHVTHLIQDGEGHVTNDVGTVDDQSVPLLEADDAISRQVRLLKGLQMCQMAMSDVVRSCSHEQLLDAPLQNTA